MIEVVLFLWTGSERINYASLVLPAKNKTLPLLPQLVLATLQHVCSIALASPCKGSAFSSMLTASPLAACHVSTLLFALFVTLPSEHLVG